MEVYIFLNLLRKLKNKIKVLLRVNYYRLFGSKEFVFDGLYGIKYVINPWSALDRHVLQKEY